MEAVLVTTYNGGCYQQGCSVTLKLLSLKVTTSWLGAIYTPFISRAMKLSCLFIQLRKPFGVQGGLEHEPTDMLRVDNLKVKDLIIAKRLTSVHPLFSLGLGLVKWEFIFGDRYHLDGLVFVSLLIIRWSLLMSQLTGMMNPLLHIKNRDMGRGSPCHKPCVEKMSFVDSPLTFSQYETVVTRFMITETHLSWNLHPV